MFNNRIAGYKEHILPLKSFRQHSVHTFIFRRNKQSRACSQIMHVGKTEQRRFQSALELSECQGSVTGRLR